jgi:peptidoglycan/LPS O-acetylase OafA/YrhL
MSNEKKRDDIQGLRAIAILAVLLFHIWPDIFKNGYAGVDM